MDDFLIKILLLPVTVKYLLYDITIIQFNYYHLLYNIKYLLLLVILQFNQSELETSSGQKNTGRAIPVTTAAEI